MCSPTDAAARRLSISTLADETLARTVCLQFLATALNFSKTAITFKLFSFVSFFSQSP